MWRDVAFHPHFCTLHNPETVLLVNNDKPQTCKIHLIFEYRMGAYKYIYFAREQRCEQRHTLFLLGASGEQFHPYGQSAEHAPQRGKMLFGKNLSGCHHTCLITIIFGKKHSQKSHKRLATAHIALNKTIHLSAAINIVTNLSHHTLLGCSKFKGQLLAVETVEYFAHFGKIVTGIFILAIFRIVQYA